MNIFCRRVTKLIPDGAGAGPLHMSPVTGLARLPGRILLSFHTVVSRKVVLQSGKSLRDNVERYCG